MRMRGDGARDLTRGQITYGFVGQSKEFGFILAVVGKGVKEEAPRI